MALRASGGLCGASTHPCRPQQAGPVSAGVGRRSRVGGRHDRALAGRPVSAGRPCKPPPPRKENGPHCTGRNELRQGHHHVACCRLDTTTRQGDSRPRREFKRARLAGRAPAVRAPAVRAPAVRAPAGRRGESPRIPPAFSPAEISAKLLIYKEKVDISLSVLPILPSLSLISFTRCRLCVSVYLGRKGESGRTAAN
jgi:hypothetical protein